jgi:hypothetical protein
LEFGVETPIKNPDEMRGTMNLGENRATHPSLSFVVVGRSATSHFTEQVRVKAHSQISLFCKAAASCSLDNKAKAAGVPIKQIAGVHIKQIARWHTAQIMPWVTATSLRSCG